MSQTRRQPSPLARTMWRYNFLSSWDRLGSTSGPRVTPSFVGDAGGSSVEEIIALPGVVDSVAGKGQGQVSVFCLSVQHQCFFHSCRVGVYVFLSVARPVFHVESTLRSEGPWRSEDRWRIVCIPYLVEGGTGIN